MGALFEKWRGTTKYFAGALRRTCAPTILSGGATATVFIDRRLNGVGLLFNLSVRNLNWKLLWHSGVKVKYVTTVPFSHPVLSSSMFLFLKSS